MDSECDDGDECTRDVCRPSGRCDHPVINDTFTLTVTTNGAGSVDLNPPGGSYACGGDVTLTAMAEAGAAFCCWEGDLTGDQNPAVLTVTANANVTAVFVDDLTGTWAFSREVTGTASNGPNCEQPAIGTQDEASGTILQTGGDITISFSISQDLDGDDLVDQSPGELWFVSVPFVCDPGNPYAIELNGTVAGDSVSVTIPGSPFVQHCACFFIHSATLDATVSNSGNTMTGTMFIELFRSCGQFPDNTCSVTYSFTAVRT